MPESSAGPITSAKAKARVDVEVILGTILLSVLCGTVAAPHGGWASAGASMSA
jgi:hypothetical protein